MTEAKDDKINVIVAMDFSDEIMEQLQNVSPRLHIERHFPDVPEEAWAKAEVLYTFKHFPDPENVPLLRWIQLHYAGMERAQTKRIVQAEDVEVTSASGIHASQMANYCMMGILTFHFNLLKMMAFKERAEWAEDRHELFAPLSLRGQTLGIAGYGSIGRELARQAHALGMKILATKRDVKHPAEIGAYAEEGTGDPEGELPERIYPGGALGDMARECDYLAITVPMTEETRLSVNESVLDAMKPSAVLINVSRGGIVDEAALISALAAEKIRGAVLDVFDEEPLPNTSPLWNLENIIISPHVSGDSADYHQKAANMFAENLKRYVNKQPLLNKLNRKSGY